MDKLWIYFCYSYIRLCPFLLPCMCSSNFQTFVVFGSQKGEVKYCEILLPHILKCRENSDKSTKMERRQKADISYTKQCFELKLLRTKNILPSTFEMNLFFVWFGFLSWFFFGGGGVFVLFCFSVLKIPFETSLMGRRSRTSWAAFPTEKPRILGE